MCVIAYGKKRDFPKDEYNECLRTNPAGNFIAVIREEAGKRKIVATVRELGAVATTKTFDEALPDDFILLHARIPSRGGKTLENVHGWKSEEGVFFCHNGTMSDIPKDGDKTDSETFFRRLFLPLWRAEGKDFTDNVKFLIGTFLGGSESYTRNKFAFLLPDGEVWLFGSFVSDHGMKYSNSSYKPVVATSYGQGGYYGGHYGGQYGKLGYYPGRYGDDIEDREDIEDLDDNRPAVAAATDTKVSAAAAKVAARTSASAGAGGNATVIRHAGEDDAWFPSFKAVIATPNAACTIRQSALRQTLLDVGFAPLSVLFPVHLALLNRLAATTWPNTLTGSPVMSTAMGLGLSKVAPGLMPTLMVYDTDGDIAECGDMADELLALAGDALASEEPTHNLIASYAMWMLERADCPFTPHRMIDTIKDAAVEIAAAAAIANIVTVPKATGVKRVVGFRLAVQKNGVKPVRLTYPELFAPRCTPAKAQYVVRKLDSVFKHLETAAPRMDKAMKEVAIKWSCATSSSGK